MVILSNAFSLNMLKGNATIKAKMVDVSYVKELVKKHGFKSVIGHASTAKVLSVLLDTNVEERREAIQLNEDDTLIVAQITVRLPEGKVLTEDEIKSMMKEKSFLVFWMIKVKYE